MELAKHFNYAKAFMPLRVVKVSATVATKRKNSKNELSKVTNKWCHVTIANSSRCEQELMKAPGASCED